MLQPPVVPPKVVENPEGIAVTLVPEMPPLPLYGEVLKSRFAISVCAFTLDANVSPHTNRTKRNLAALAGIATVG